MDLLPGSGLDLVEEVLFAQKIVEVAAVSGLEHH
jgi:hypothetical protein